RTSTAAVTSEIPSSRTSRAWAAGAQSASVQLPSCMCSQATGTGGRNRPRAWPCKTVESGLPAARHKATTPQLPVRRHPSPIPGWVGVWDGVEDALAPPSPRDTAGRRIDRLLAALVRELDAEDSQE